MMYSAYKLSKQGDNIQPWHTPFPIWNQSIVSCLVLSVASWPAYRFHRRQVRWSGIPITLRISQFVVIHTVKGFSILNEAEVGVLANQLQKLILTTAETTDREPVMRWGCAWVRQVEFWGCYGAVVGIWRWSISSGPCTDLLMEFVAQLLGSVSLGCPLWALSAAPYLSVV